MWCREGWRNISYMETQGKQNPPAQHSAVSSQTLIYLHFFPGLVLFQFSWSNSFYVLFLVSLSSTLLLSLSLSHKHTCVHSKTEQTNICPEGSQAWTTLCFSDHIACRKNSASCNPRLTCWHAVTEGVYAPASAFSLLAKGTGKHEVIKIQCYILK